MKRRMMATAGVLGAGALVWAAIAIAADVDCSGGGKQCNGTPFDDEITGTRKVDAINAKAGNDSSYGKNGNDTVESGAGNDYVEGGKGDDVISGGDDSDQFIIGGLFGGPGDDTISGGDGDDDAYGEAGKDVLSGGPGADQLDGTDLGADTRDRLNCGGGVDTAIVTPKDKTSDCEDVIPER
jgi:Ca2+-binding RTX toxin-like protein